MQKLWQEQTVYVMASPFLKSILTWRKLVAEKKQRRKQENDERIGESKTNGSEASDISEHVDELSSNLKQTCDAMWSPSFRTTRRHAICEENIREYYMFWCVNHVDSFGEEASHSHHDHHNDQHRHQNRHFKRKL